MKVSPAVIPFLTQPSTLGVGCELRENPIRKQRGDYIRSDIETTTRARTFSLVLMRWDFGLVSGEQGGVKEFMTKKGTEIFITKRVVCRILNYCFTLWEMLVETTEFPSRT